MLMILFWVAVTPLLLLLLAVIFVGFLVQAIKGLTE